MSEILPWSPSKSQRWRSCPRQHLYKEIGAKPSQRPARRILRGQLIHAGMEGALRAAAKNRHRGTRSLAAFLADAQDAMDAHPDAAAMSIPDTADCLRIVGNALARLETPAPESIIGIEVPFSFRYSGILIDGVIDLALRTGPTSLLVLDWKTGKIPERSEEIEGHTALNTYSVAAPILWPWAHDVSVGLYSVPHGKSVTVTATREMQELALSRLVRDCRAAYQARRRLDVEPVDAVFPARSGDHCTSCVFRSYCPLFAESSPPVRPGVDVAGERRRIAAKIGT